MKFLVCLLRGHRPVKVRLIDVMVIPDSGLQTVYERSDDGDRFACERCRRVLRETT